MIRMALLVCLISLALFSLPLPATRAEDPPSPEIQLTEGPKDDEDGAFLLADDGTIHFAYISNGAGNMDVLLISSKDGVTWSAPRVAVATPRDDLLNSATRTSDGLYHLTGRTQFMVGDSTSKDMQIWTEPAHWTDPRKLGWTAGYFREAPNGDYWLVSLSNRSGVHKLYMQKSSDRGKTWSDPAPLTKNDRAEYIFAFEVTLKGDFLLVWQQHDPRDAKKLAPDSSDIYFATSRDGVQWTEPVLLSPETGSKDFDLWPSILVGPDNTYYATWLTSRVGLRIAPGVVMVPIHPKLDVDDMRVVPAYGYSVRSTRLPDGQYILAYVKTNPKNHSKDYFARIVSDFNFPRVPAGALGKRAKSK